MTERGCRVRERGIVRMVALVAAAAMLMAACSSADEPTTSNTPGGAAVKGGTLRVVTNSDVTATMDPQREYYQLPFAYFRCCLQRTLMSYNGQDAEHDGTKVFPDLAAEPPTISDDSMTWTFKIKEGLMYSPPLETVEITAGDFIRAIMREYNATVGGPYAFYYDVIEGVDAFKNGDSDTISGMTAIDDHTLEIKLTEPIGDLDYRFAMAATGPIPPNPDSPDDPLGVAQGHEDEGYGRFFVSTGPYMFEGSENLDFSVPADQQKPVSGYKPKRSLLFIRNPSWAQDDLRPAYVDSVDIEMELGEDGSVLEKKVQDDEFDTEFANGVAPETLQTFESDPELKDQIFKNPSFGNYYLEMNAAVPPFDDEHVRRAVNFAVNKEGWRRFSGGESSGTIAGHYVPDGLLDNQLIDYNPFATPNNAGADSPEGLQLAMDEMKQSKYDTDQDGLCDAPECSGILAIGVVGTQSEAADALIADNLKKIGVELNLKSLENATAYNKVFDPKAHLPVATFVGWLMDWPEAFTFFFATSYGKSILDQYNTNYTMIGATPEQLQKYGYDVTSVPSIDADLEACIPVTGDERVTCFAELDKKLTELAVYVPLTFTQNVNIVSSRVTNFTWSAFDSQTAFEQVALVAGSD
jgi:peptide/nickel transport system substrate-binding protein